MTVDKFNRPIEIGYYVMYPVYNEFRFAVVKSVKDERVSVLYLTMQNSWVAGTKNYEQIPVIKRGIIRTDEKDIMVLSMQQMEMINIFDQRTELLATVQLEVLAKQDRIKENGKRI